MADEKPAKAADETGPRLFTAYLIGKSWQHTDGEAVKVDEATRDRLVREGLAKAAGS